MLTPAMKAEVYESHSTHICNGQLLNLVLLHYLSCKLKLTVAIRVLNYENSVLFSASVLHHSVRFAQRLKGFGFRASSHGKS